MRSARRLRTPTEPVGELLKRVSPMVRRSDEQISFVLRGLPAVPLGERRVVGFCGWLAGRKAFEGMTGWV